MRVAPRVSEDYRRSVLPNGIRVVTERMPHVRSVAVGIWVETGSRHEPEARGGMSHLIEHLVFKGTASRSAADIARIMDSVGGHTEAFTTKEHTCFYAQVLDEHLPLAVDLLTDILLHPRFDPDELEREKQVVLEEFKMVDDTPDELVHDLFAEQVWKGHPLGRPILGTKQRVTGFSRDLVAEHFIEEYVPPKVIIAAAGNATHEQVVDLFGRGFNGFVRSPVSRPDTTPALHPSVNVVHKQLEQVQLVMGFPGLRQSAPERYALFLLNDILGGSGSSRLFQEVRERQGLAYAIYSGLQSFFDTGVLYVGAATSPENVTRLLQSVLKELRDLKKNGVTAEELKRAKDHLKGSLMLSLETSPSRMSRLAKQEMHLGTFMTMDDMLGAIERVRHEEVQALIGELLDEDRLALTTLGPLDRRTLPRDLLRN